MTNVCPECAGRVMEGHPAGVLAIQHRVECKLSAAEDATRNNDNELAWWGRRERPATVTERILLAALGYTLPDVLTTYVQGTGGAYRRAWRGIEPRESDHG